MHTYDEQLAAHGEQLVRFKSLVGQTVTFISEDGNIEVTKDLVAFGGDIYPGAMIKVADLDPDTITVRETQVIEESNSKPV